ncbi:MAG TPA: fatty acid CoA ligase family protein [Myxococcota bacterium]|nr:fatty acid CoA ligase family protein [Myxococcota bacterium]
MNFAARLDRLAAERPRQRALVRPAGRDPRDGRRLWAQLTFSQLHEMTNSTARGFASAGIGQGDRVILLVEPSFEFFSIIFALWKLGAVPVLIDPGMGLSGFLACVRQIRPRVCIGVPRAMLLSKLKATDFESVELRVTVGPSTWFWGGETLPLLMDPGPLQTLDVPGDAVAGVLFTSGSTGPAKGVRYSHGMFEAQATRIAALYGIEAGQVDVPCFLPFAMFSCVMGMTVVLPDMDFSKPATARPEALAEAIIEHGAHQLVGSPAVMRRLARWAPDKGVRFPSLERVLTFGAPIPRDLHETFRELLAEGVDIHTPYGATEALPVASTSTTAILAELGARTASGEGTCVGGVAPDTNVRVIRITDEPIPTWSEELVLPPGEVGEICVKGPQVSSEYVGRPEATSAAKIQDGEGFWHRMGDLGFVDAQGRLWFCGRKAHRVRCSDGELVFPVPLEGVFNEVDGVLRSAVVEVSGAPVLVVEGKADEGELLRVAKANPVTRRVERVLFHPGFPVDRRHNAKIHRLQLRDWARDRT